MPNILLRPANTSDLPGILEIYNDAILNTTSVYFYKPHTLEMRQAWFDEKVLQNLPVVVAQDDGKVAGFCTYGPFRPCSAYQYTVEHSVYVSADYRKNGIATMLMKNILGKAKEAGCHAMIAGIDSANEASFRLHEKFGFKEVGRFSEVGYKFDRWLDLVFMELLLENDPQNQSQNL